MIWLAWWWHWVMSWVPWWAYAAGAVGVYALLRARLPGRLGEIVATGYAVVAAAFVAADYGGDAREAWVRAQWATQAAAAQSAAAGVDKDAAADKGADLQDALDTQIRKYRELEDAIRSENTGDCNLDDVLKRLQQ